MDEVVPAGPAGPALDREEAVQRLVERFVAGHGPTSVKDLMRWARLTKAEATRALAEAGFDSAVVQGVPVWFHPRPGPASSSTVEGSAWLLPTFDEAFLSHDRPRFPRPDGHPWDTRHVSPAEAGGGVVVVGGRDVGVFKRRVRAQRLTVEVWLAPGAGAADAAGARIAADRLGRHLGMAPTLDVHELG